MNHRDVDYVLAIAAVILIALFIAVTGARACSADVGRANTDVYVRSMDDGSVVGSLAKGDLVVVTGHKGGWYRVDIGGRDYKIWGDYLEVRSGICLDEVNVIGKARKSRSASGPVRNAEQCSITGSIFDGMEFF